MAISMRTNMASLDTQRNMSVNQRDLDSSMRKLASGYRITRAADDAAGLAISEKMRKQIIGTNQAIRNANDGISMIQTAEGGLGEIENIVQRIRELAVQAANGTLVSADMIAVSKEMEQIKSEITAIADRTNFNGISLLNGDAGTVTLQIGADEGNIQEVTFVNFAASNTSNGVGSLGTIVGSFSAVASANGLAASFQEVAQRMLTVADHAIASLNNQRAELGASQNRLEHNIAVQQVAADNLSAANSRIRDVDVAAESASMTKANILMQAGVSVLSQANQQPQMALKLLGG